MMYRMARKTLVVAIALAAAAALGLYALRSSIAPLFFEPTPSGIEDGVPRGAQAPEVVAEGLEIPWEIAFLPDGDVLVTERPGRLLRIGRDRAVIEVAGVAHRGEGGLLGLALHPDYAQNGWIYLYLTTAEEGGLTNRVERYVLRGASLSERTTIIGRIPGASNHDGGRIAFGPDRMLYITTGDAGNEASAQDTKNLAGKILRIQEDGAIPAGNPFGNAVYSYGHRNVQGLAWDAAGELWATEHGRSGVRSGYDELNKIRKGGNYGWPEIEGSESRPGMESPALHSGASETWAPSGMAHAEGRLIFAGLRGEALYAVDISDGGARGVQAYFRETYGRLRTVALGPDGLFYILTNNRDGRGDSRAGDDRIVRVDPAALGL